MQINNQTRFSRGITQGMCVQSSIFSRRSRAQHVRNAIRRTPQRARRRREEGEGTRRRRGAVRYAFSSSFLPEQRSALNGQLFPSLKEKRTQDLGGLPILPLGSSMRAPGSLFLLRLAILWRRSHANSFTFLPLCRSSTWRRHRLLSVSGQGSSGRRNTK